MLHDFLSANRAEVIGRCGVRTALKPALPVDGRVVENGIPPFLDQLIRTLRAERAADGGQSGSLAAEMSTPATRHGLELLEQGYSVDQVVQVYGDLCQAVTDLAFERAAPIDIDEFRTLNRCLDNAIAAAVGEFALRRDALRDAQRARTLAERLGSFAHELRNHIHTATLAVSALKAGGGGFAGATGAVLDRSLIAVRTLIDRSLVEVRASAGMPPRLELLSLAAVFGEVRGSAALGAQARGCHLAIAPVDHDLAVEADRELLLCALENLLQNAFKFTAPRTQVSLTAHAAADRALIEVADHCGGLPPGQAQRLFTPFVQSASDRSGMGLGLSIARRSIEASWGRLLLRDVPGTGCVFTIDLPRRSLAGACVR